MNRARIEQDKTLITASAYHARFANKSGPKPTLTCEFCSAKIEFARSHAKEGGMVKPYFRLAAGAEHTRQCESLETDLLLAPEKILGILGRGQTPLTVPELKDKNTAHTGPASEKQDSVSFVAAANYRIGQTFVALVNDRQTAFVLNGAPATAVMERTAVAYEQAFKSLLDGGPKPILISGWTSVRHGNRIGCPSWPNVLNPAKTWVWVDFGRFLPKGLVARMEQKRGTLLLVAGLARASHNKASAGIEYQNVCIEIVSPAQCAFLSKDTLAKLFRIPSCH